MQIIPKFTNKVLNLFMDEARPQILNTMLSHVQGVMKEISSVINYDHGSL